MPIVTPILMAKKYTRRRTLITDVQGIEYKPKTTARKAEEKKLSYLIAEYLVLQYPKTVFRFDVAADVRLTIGQAMIIKDKLKHRRGYHDLTILEPRGGYFGLFIELKKDKSEVFTQKGELSKKKRPDGSDHNKEQFLHLKKMSGKGYYATYGFGFDHTKALIDEYMSKKPTEILK